MGLVWRRIVIACTVLLIGAAAGAFAVAATGRGHAGGQVMRTADVGRVSTVQAAPSGPCFVSDGAGPSQACGDSVCTEFIDDPTTQAGGPVPDGSECQRVITAVVRGRPMLVRSSGLRSGIATAPLRGTLRGSLRARMRVLVRAISR
jgi:hypothetical protein